MRSGHIAAALVGAAGVAWAPAALACSSTACLMSANRTTGETLPDGAWRAGVSFRYADQSAKRAGLRSVDEVRRPYVSLTDGVVYPGFHDDYANREQLVQVDAAYGLTPRATAYASYTLLADRFMRGGDETCLNPYGARGLGDLVVGLRHRTGFARFPLVVGAALKIPTGASSLPERIGDAIMEPMVQPGSGSWDPIVSISGSLSRRTAFSFSHQRATTNALGYRFGDETVAAVTRSRPLTRAVTGTLQVRSVRKGRSRLKSESVPSSGGIGVYLSPGVNVSVGGISGYAIPTLPVFRHVNESQLAFRAGVLVGVVKAF